MQWRYMTLTTLVWSGVSLLLQRPGLKNLHWKLKQNTREALTLWINYDVFGYIDLLDIS